MQFIKKYSIHLLHTQILKDLPDFHKTQHERYATEGHLKVIIYNLFRLSSKNTMDVPRLGLDNAPLHISLLIGATLGEIQQC
jgi:hypothetical protein